MTALYTAQYGWGGSPSAHSVLLELTKRAPPAAAATARDCRFALLSPDVTRLLRNESVTAAWRILPLRVDAQVERRLSARAASKLPKLDPLLLFPGAEFVVFVDFKLALNVPVDELVEHAFGGGGNRSGGESFGGAASRDSRLRRRPFLSAFRHPCVADTPLPSSIAIFYAPSAPDGKSIAPPWCRGISAQPHGWSARDWMLEEIRIISSLGKIR